MKKILYVATVVKTHIMTFHIPFLKMLKEMGYETAVAARNDYENPADCVIPYCDNYYDIPFERSPLKLLNIKAYKALKKLINEGNYDIIHCHTPVGAMLTRLAASGACKRGTKVIYTAHGFHFFKGAPLKNWLLYYPVEKLCSYLTDVLITINKEDYALAQQKMKAKKVVYIPGVGIDLEKFRKTTINKQAKRAELGIPEKTFLLLSVGELNRNKNHETVIRAIAEMPNVHYMIAGQGPLQDHLQALILNMELSERVHLLGFRTDIPELCKAADAFVFPSFREGLSVSLMEAMACGLPVACSRIRGNTDLIDEDGGILFDPHSVEDCRNAIETLVQQDLHKLSEYNLERIHAFRIEQIIEATKKLYSNL